MRQRPSIDWPFPTYDDTRNNATETFDAFLCPATYNKLLRATAASKYEHKSFGHLVSTDGQQAKLHYEAYTLKEEEESAQAAPANKSKTKTKNKTKSKGKKQDKDSYNGFDKVTADDFDSVDKPGQDHHRRGPGPQGPDHGSTAVHHHHSSSSCSTSLRVCYSYCCYILHILHIHLA